MIELIQDWENGMSVARLGRKHGLSGECQARLQTIHITSLPPPAKTSRLTGALVAGDTAAVPVSKRRRMRMEEVVAYFLALRDGFRKEPHEYKNMATLEVTRVLEEMKRRAV